MKQQTIMGQALLGGHTACKVLYHQASDMVEVEVGGIRLRLEANSFILMHEMLRKAAAKIVMQTSLEAGAGCAQAVIN